jgi:hypothetical protein
MRDFCVLKSALVSLCIVSLVAVGCSKDHPLYPSYEELTQRGFYVYVLPKNEVERRQWSQTVSIWSWNKHCRGIETSETSNPIRIRYDGSQSGLTLLLGPWSLYWDHRESTSEVELETPWTIDGRAVYYEINEDDEDYIHLRFKDRFGIPVQVLSNLPIAEVVQLINQLEYVGPSPRTVTNPWDASRCEER